MTAVQAKLPAEPYPPVATTALESVLTSFEAVSLSDVTEASLANRLDKKYLFRREQLVALLEHVQSDFNVLEVAGTRRQAYSSLYYDTAQFQFYNDHHNGVRSRYKVRLREYLATGQRFMEVKCKTSDDRTKKQRLELGAYPALAILTLFADTLPPSYQQLQPVLRTSYKRIALVHKSRQERLTLDLDLSLSLPDSASCTRRLTDLVILEHKSDIRQHAASFNALRRAFGLRVSSFSKYCIGCALFYPGLKRNLFKPTLRNLQTLTNEATS